MSGVLERVDAAGVDAQAGTAALSRGQLRNLSLAAVGTLLEFYEFTVFGFFATTISQVFFSPEMPQWLREFQTFAIFALGYLVRPFSGTVIGHLGDKFGRKKLFLFTLFMMALPTTLIGLLPGYAEIGIAAPILLLVIRLCQGIAVAGETAGSTVFVAEHVPGSRFGRACGWLFGATYLGFFLGAAVGALVSNLFDTPTLNSIGWRLPFIVGGALGFVAVYLRRYLDETPLFEEIRVTKRRATAFPFGEVLRGHRKASLFVLGLAAYLGTLTVAWYFYLPSLLQSPAYGLGRTAVFEANTAALFFLAVMCPVWGAVADRIGFGRVLVLGAVGQIAVAILFFANAAGVSAAPGHLIWWYLAISLFFSTAPVIPALAALVFPTEVRFTGFAFNYNVGAALFSGTAPIVLSWLVHELGRTAMPYFVIPAAAVGVIVGLLAPIMTLHPKQG